ncbi:MAG: hypothetical protein U0892_06075 [Pirellulales bacterium]
MIPEGMWVWAAAATIAGFCLFSMMRRRQLYLIKLLKEYVDRKATWQRRVEKSLQLAAQIEAAEAKKAAKIRATIKDVSGDPAQEQQAEQAAA